MQIKYLKDAPLGQMGDVAAVADDQARVLITLGYAEMHAKSETKPRSKAKKDDKTADLLAMTDDNE
nr:hypothetical protein [uncultured Moraxella sp.]